MTWLTDLFVEPSQTALNSHTPDEGGAWTLRGTGPTNVLGSSVGEAKVAGANAHGYSNPGANGPLESGVVECDHKMQASTATEFVGSGLRFSTGTGANINGYAAGLLQTGGSRFSALLLWNDAAIGAPTLVAFDLISGYSGTTFYRHRLEAVGSSFRVFRDGALVISATDANVATGTELFVAAALGNALRNMRYRNLACYSFRAPAPIGRTSRVAQRLRRREEERRVAQIWR